MKKIISLFQRNYDGDGLVRDEIVPGAEWVVAGEGIATRKWDGSCCMVRNRKLYKRYDVKKGRTAPAEFDPAQEPDPMTGHWPGWLPVGEGPDDKWHREAWANTGDADRPSGIGDIGLADGTYELVGPKINGNPERMLRHEFIAHGQHEIPDAPITFAGLRDYLDGAIEGIVWWHPDGRMVKIKAKDFGIKRKIS